MGKLLKYGLITTGAYLLLRNVYLGPEPAVQFGNPATYPCNNPRNSKIIATLHPKIRLSAYRACRAAELKGYNIFLLEGYRSWRRQFWLYKNTPYTHANAGESYHNYGLAVDVYVVDASGKKNNPTPEVVTIFKQNGFSWGGDWRSFKDYPHFQKHFGIHWSILLKRIKEHKVNSDGYVII